MSATTSEPPKPIGKPRNPNFDPTPGPRAHQIPSFHIPESGTNPISSQSDPFSRLVCQFWKNWKKCSEKVPKNQNLQDWTSYGTISQSDHWNQEPWWLSHLGVSVKKWGLICKNACFGRFLVKTLFSILSAFCNSNKGWGKIGKFLVPSWGCSRKAGGDKGKIAIFWYLVGVLL